MQFLNVGILELFLILVLAFIVLGPNKAIKTAGDIGRWIKDFVKSPLWKQLLSTSNELRDLPNKIMDEAEIKNTIQDFEHSSKEIKKAINQVQFNTNQDLEEVKQEINQKLQRSSLKIELPDDEEQA